MAAGDLGPASAASAASAAVSSAVGSAARSAIYILLLSSVGVAGPSSASAASRARMTYERCSEDALVASEVFCLPSDYRKDVPPDTGTGPIPVYINLPLSEISSIDDQHSQISLRLSYKLLWPEPRMVLNSSADWSRGEINVGAELVKHFWTPDIIIHDLVKFKKPVLIKEVAALEIRAEKSVFYNVRSDLTVVCKGMNFALYPFDEHVCYLKLTSFGHDNTEMVLVGGYTYHPVNQRALYFTVAINEMDGNSTVFVGKNSNYSMYALEFHLTRIVSQYLLNVYLPTGIFVIISWVSFIIPVEIIAARVVLLITLTLVLINMFNKVTEGIPVARQETALEFWVCGCICLVFSALAEYAFILWNIVRLRRRHRTRLSAASASIRPRPEADEHTFSDASQGIPDSAAKRFLKRYRSQWRDNLEMGRITGEGRSRDDDKFNRQMAKYQEDFDEHALLIYPSMFLVFNVGYWLHYIVFS